MTILEKYGFDPDLLRAKYRQERDKRLRPEGVDQFTAIAGEHEHYRDDPYVEPGFCRAPLSDEVDIAVIGGGFGGLLAGAQLRKAGLDNIRMIDKAGDFGGTWYWNRYPGAACDTESYIYLPLLEELGVMPPRKYATQPEILAHCQLIARTFDLYRDACFQTEVTSLDWDEKVKRWIIRTNRNDAMRARFVVLSPGPMDRPKLAGIPGLEQFQGHSFHTSRWDYAYTGGDSSGGLSGLADKAVGIIGTGATAIQCVPHLAAGAKQLTVFQRTPSSLDFRDNRPTDPDWTASLEPGWHQRRMENFTTLITGGHADEDLIKDGWTSVAANLKSLVAQHGKDADLGELALIANFMKMEELRGRVEATVTDRETAEALKPWYDHFCKRPCFHDDYLPVFNRANVTLIDTGGKGVERITEQAVVVDGQQYPIDCLVYSTGYEASAPLAKRIGYPITGRNGLTLEEKWRGGAATFHGYTTRGFPNLLLMSHVQSGLSLNFPHMISEQAQHVAWVLSQAIAQQVQTIEASAEAEADWVAEIDRTATSQQAFQKECTPSYFNFEGDLKRLNVRNSPYGGGPLEFFGIIAAWREDGTLSGLEIE